MEGEDGSNSRIIRSAQSNKGAEVGAAVLTTTNRAQLFGTKRRSRRRRGGGSGNDDSMNQSASEAASIQQSLSRTRALLQNELDRVAGVSNAIETDKKLIDETLQRHKTMDVGGARKALTALERAQQFERRVLAASVAFFWSVVAYILWCRVVSKLPFVDLAIRTALARLGVSSWT